MKILRANKKVDSIFNDLRELDLKDLILMPTNDWLEKRMNEFDFDSDFYDKEDFLINVSYNT